MDSQNSKYAFIRGWDVNTLFFLSKCTRNSRKDVYRINFVEAKQQTKLKHEYKPFSNIGFS